MHTVEKYVVILLILDTPIVQKEYMWNSCMMALLVPRR